MGNGRDRLPFSADQADGGVGDEAHADAVCRAGGALHRDADGGRAQQRSDCDGQGHRSHAPAVAAQPSHPIQQIPRFGNADEGPQGVEAQAHGKGNHSGGQGAARHRNLGTAEGGCQ